MPIRNEKDFLDPRSKIWLALASASAFSGISTAPFSVISPTPGIKGIDVAPDYQAGEVISVKQMVDAGYLFVFSQMTRGLWHHQNGVDFAKPFVDGGMFVMPYGLLDANKSGVSQAMELLEDAHSLWQYQGYITPAMVDVEVRDGATISVRQARYKEYVDEIRKEALAVTYSSYYLWLELMNGMALHLNDIGFVAAWNRYDTFTPPTGWPVDQIKFRQIGVALKHEWVEPVPGMKSDVDSDVGFMTAEELWRLSTGAMPPSPSEPPIEEDIGVDYEKIDAFLARYPQAQVILHVNGGALETTDNGGDNGNGPPPVTTKTYTVTEDKSIAYQISGYNQADPPAGPYPTMVQVAQELRTRQPFKNTTGQTVQVTERIRADGAKYFWKVYGETYPNPYKAEYGDYLYLEDVRGNVV